MILLIVSAIVLFSFGHWIGGVICLALIVAAFIVALKCDF
jgi:hypothetical protein